MSEKSIFEMTTQELRKHLQKQTDLRFKEWLQSIQSTTDIINAADIHKYLHTIFQEIPFDRSAIGKVIENTVEYLDPKTTTHFKHLILLGKTFFGQRHLTFILKSILQPLADHNHYTIHTFTERELHENIARHGGIFNIHTSARVLIFQLSSVTSSTHNLIAIIQKAIETKFKGILITAWTDESWLSMHNDIISIDHPHEIISFKTPTTDELIELLQYVLKYIGYTKPVKSDLLLYIIDQSNGNIDHAINIVVEAFRNMCDANVKTLSFNDVIAGTLSVLHHKEERDRIHN